MPSDHDEIDYDDLEQLLKATEPSKEEQLKQSARRRLVSVTPDTLWGHTAVGSNDGITFLYDHGKLIFDRDANKTHEQVAKEFGWQTKSGSMDRYDFINSGYTLGRTGRLYEQNVVSLWNRPQYPESIMCVRKLLAMRLVTSDYFVCGDESGVVTVAELLGEKQMPANAPVTQKFSPEMLAKAHLLTPSGFKKAMNGRQTQRPPASGIPGVKWWAPTSESFREFIDRS